MLDDEKQWAIVNAWTHPASFMQEGAATFSNAMFELGRPSTIYKPKLSKDGDQWCVLFGDNLEEGVSGFGKSPEKAMKAFDEAWIADIK